MQEIHGLAQEVCRVQIFTTFLLQNCLRFVLNIPDPTILTGRARENAQIVGCIREETR
jgi:hypothetical protein